MRSKKEEKKYTFEEQLARLQAIVAEFERDDASLEKSVELYKEGVELVKLCKEKLAKAKHNIQIFSEEAMLPFDGTDIITFQDKSDNIE